MHMEDQELLFRHGVLVAAEAVDSEDGDAGVLYAFAGPLGELARRNFRSVRLLDDQLLLILEPPKVNPQHLGSAKEQPQLLFENEQRAALTPRNRGRDKL